VTALKRAVTDRTDAPGAGDLTLNSTVETLAQRWLVDMEDSDLSRSTKARYRTIAEAFVVPAIGALGCASSRCRPSTASCEPSAAPGVPRPRRVRGVSSQIWSAWRCVTVR
jgi:hypothetical protein